LYDYGARLYDPVLARFISPDPVVANLFNPQAINSYSYAMNNPLIYVDPTGKVCRPVEVLRDIANTIFNFIDNSIRSLVSGIQTFTNWSTDRMFSLLGGNGNNETHFDIRNVRTPNVVASNVVASSRDIPNSITVSQKPNLSIGSTFTPNTRDTTVEDPSQYYKDPSRILGPYLDPKFPNFINSYPVIFYERNTKFNMAQALAGSSKQEHGALTTATSGAILSGSTRVIVNGPDMYTPAYWRAQIWTATGQYEPETDAPIYGWKAVGESTAINLDVTRDAVNYFYFLGR